MPRINRFAAAACGAVLALSACSNPYDPGQRALGGAAIGAGAGAAIGGLAGGWHGAAIGALAGGALGAVTGAVTTPRPPPARVYSAQYLRGHPAWCADAARDYFASLSRRSQL